MEPLVESRLISYKEYVSAYKLVLHVSNLKQIELYHVCNLKQSLSGPAYSHPPFSSACHSIESL
jgi:hypothetical protein